MIDLEHALAALVETAPSAPDVAGVVWRGRQRRSRRRGVRATALVVLVAGIAGGITLASSRHPSKVSVLTPTTDTVRMTMLDGSHLEITGPSSLGLADLTRSFNAELDPVSPQRDGVGHTLSVERAMPEDLGPVVGRYPTHDGHELVVHATARGIDAVVQYEGWVLVLWHNGPTQWAKLASALNATVGTDGYLVIKPANARWLLLPTDAPDAQLGGTAYGSDAVFSFFGPSTYSSGCPTESETRTAQGWPVMLNNGAWWCDPDAKVRVRVGDPALVDAAMQGLRMTLSNAPEPSHAP